MGKRLKLFVTRKRMGGWSGSSQENRMIVKSEYIHDRQARRIYTQKFNQATGVQVAYIRSYVVYFG